MGEELADLIREILGSREAVQATLQGSEYALVNANTDVWSHFWASVRRKLEGIQIAWWEVIGAITYNVPSKELATDMEQVPDELYQRALNIVKSQAIPGSLPKFDQKVFGTRYTYRIVATLEWPSHMLVFYRRPKNWFFP